MKLRITFSGSCLFVPKLAEEGKPNRVHVVMPLPHGHHGEDRHVCVLMFKAGYLRQGASNAGPEWVVRSLENCILSIPGLGADLGICPDIIDLRPLVKSDLGSVLQDEKQGKAVARVDLQMGKMGRVARGACWEWEYDTPRRLAHIAEWEIEIGDQNSVTLPLLGWTEVDPLPLPTLHAIGGLVEVFVYNLPPSDLPPAPEVHHDPAAKSEAPHFGQYFTLFDTRVPEWRPRFAVQQGCLPVTGACEEIPNTGGSPFNCMLASLGLPPTDDGKV